ncbi:hypothetical protein EH31_17015 [Erythrobacter longus]|uniref:Uncharacterized protein n=1 Tax=Erythrobacter longus TaxID=1044 RepID=A0A074M7H9_ERYLO|nr:hypothetical protein [Erythrobacter longus]KEO88655.1 hypothetical protein EH31_17015 [Erythrobacter longus]
MMRAAKRWTMMCAAALGLVCSSSASAQAAWQQVQTITWVAQAEQVERKCDAFTHEGRFLYREVKSRMVTFENVSLYERISQTQADRLAGQCRDLKNNPDAKYVVNYFNNEGARMLALHHFLPAASPCRFANEPAFRQRASAAWAAISNSSDPRHQPSAMQREADIIASQCQITDIAGRKSAHPAAFMAETLLPIFQKPARYGGEMLVSGTRVQDRTWLEGRRNPDAEIVKGGSIAGLTVGTRDLFRAGILTDGRVILVEKDQSNSLFGVASVDFHAGTKTYQASSGRSLDPQFRRVFILDGKASAELLQQPDFRVSLTQSSGIISNWGETNDFSGRKRAGTSEKPIQFDVTAFKAALEYSNAPKYQ